MAQKTGKSSAGKSTKKSKQEKSAAGKTKEIKQGNPSGTFLAQAGPYLMAVCGILLAVVLLAGDGIIGGTIQKVLCGLLGIVAYTLPVYFLILAFLWHTDYEAGILRWKAFAAVVILLLTAQLAHIFDHGPNTLYPAELYVAGMGGHAGGVLGGWLGELMISGFGKICTLVIAFCILTVLILYLFGITPKGLWITLLYKIRVSREKAAERKQNAAVEKKQNAGIAARNRVREEQYAAYLREKKLKEKEEKKAEREAMRQAEIQASAQIPLPQPQPTVYRVKKHRKVTDIPIDDFPDQGEQSGEDLGQTVFSEADAGAINEQIFDEVMRRTRERVERSARQSGVTLDAEQREETAQQNKAVANAVNTVDFDVPWEEDDAESASVQTVPAVDVARDSIHNTAGAHTENTPEELDLAGLFVNPEDADLLDKLSEAYLKKEDKPASMAVNRETVSQPEKALKSLKAAPIPYNFPPVEILTEDTDDTPTDIKEELQDNAVKLVETLRSFHVRTKIENISRGPTITRYELKPEPGTKVRSIANLVDDIALNLATSGVRIEAPIPGKAAVGIEVPNKKQSTVHLRTLIESEAFQGAKSSLTCCLGEDVAGEAVYFDIGKMPHLLIAGATGSGKSVCINSIVTSILYKASPEDVKMILIDPKKVELNIYNGIPHLLVPVVSEPKKAAGSLSWAVGEMERRYGLIEAVGVRDIKAFNEITKDDPDYEYMPRIVIIIDELADLMMTAPDDVEESICRIAQKARAAGMHLIIGTQRPSVDVITGLIKANIPSRIAFRTSSQIDSRTIIDIGTAANLIGMGDMLFNPVGAMKPRRVQGAYISEADVEEVVAYIKNMNQKNQSYSDEVLEQIEKEAARCGSGKKGGSSSSTGGGDADSGEEDPMLRSALELAVESGKISTSLIQRRLQLGYGRAAKLIDRMEQMGYVSQPDGQKPRKVLLTKQEFMEMILSNEIE